MVKLKRARMQQVIVKAVNADGSTKMMVADETMTAWDVCKILVEKNRTQLGPNWTLIERIPHLHLGEQGPHPPPPMISSPSLPVHVWVVSECGKCVCICLSVHLCVCV